MSERARERLQSIVEFGWGSCGFVLFIGWRMVAEISTAKDLSGFVDWASNYLSDHAFLQLGIVCIWLTVLVFWQEISRMVSSRFPKTLRMRLKDAEDQIEAVNRDLGSQMNGLVDTVNEVKHDLALETAERSIGRPVLELYISDVRELVTEVARLLYSFVVFRDLYGGGGDFVDRPFSKWRPKSIGSENFVIQGAEQWARMLELHFARFAVFCGQWKQDSFSEELAGLVRGWKSGPERGDINSSRFIELMQKHHLDLRRLQARSSSRGLEISNSGHTVS